MIHISELDGGVAVLSLDTPGPVNTLSKAFNAAFADAVEQVAGDEAVNAILVTSAKSTFATGGDVDELAAADSPQAVGDIVGVFNAALRRLETCGKPVAAALNGSALGGGYEIALACHRRFAADDPAARFGMPETGLGLMPGAGGTQRLPRLIGIAAAAELILPGTTLSAADALDRGLVDELTSPDELIDTAAAWLRQDPDPTQPWDRRGFVAPGFDPNDRKGRAWFAGAWAQSRARFGGSDAAGRAVLFALHHGMERRFDAALAVERRMFCELAASASAKNMMRVRFFGPKALKPTASAPGDITTLGVVGGGVMGCGIAFAAARAGIDVILVDRDDAAVEASLDRVAGIAARQVKRNRMTEAQSDALLDTVTGTADYAALIDADVVIEAVFEQAELKATVLGQIEAATRPDVPIASNTSTMPIAGLASALSDPSRLVGMHFFSPVETMKLLEIVHGPATSEAVARRAEGLGATLRKSVITVNDGLGFFTSRIVSSLSGETVALLAEGVAPQVIDNVMKTAGFALGPASLPDLTTVPLLKDIMTSMCGEGRQVSLTGIPVLETLDALLEAGRSGKAQGGGVYDYGDAGVTPWPGLVDLFGRNDDIDPQDVADRLLMTQSLEAQRALDAGVVSDPLAADTAASMGWGYPAALGGPFAYIDTVGRSEFVRRCDELASRYGDRFAVPESLRPDESS